MPLIDFICLANSYKLAHRCIAGLRVDGAGWIRPVSEREHGELRREHYNLPDQSEPRTLDVVRVGLSNPQPLPHQPENWRIDGSQWDLIERPASERYAPVIAASVSQDPLLFGTTGRSLSEAQIRERLAEESLVIVEPGDIRWRTEFNHYKRRNKARVVFNLGPQSYDLPLTDPAYVGLVKGLQIGDHASTELDIADDRRILLTISLSEPLDGMCYKLVAAVVALPSTWNAFF